MAIANVTLSDTFFQWMTKTNQINFQSEEAISIATVSYGGSNSAATIAVGAFGKANILLTQHIHKPIQQFQLMVRLIQLEIQLMQHFFKPTQLSHHQVLHLIKLIQLEM
jgi:hypothetical protein